MTKTWVQENKIKSLQNRYREIKLTYFYIYLDLTRLTNTLQLITMHSFHVRAFSFCELHSHRMEFVIQNVLS